MKVHIVTGGGSGIGLECAKKLPEGIVVITGRNEVKLQKAVKVLGNLNVNAKYFIADVSKRDSVKELLEYANSLGEIGSVVNSAGVSGDGADVRKTLEIDLMGPEILIDELYNYVNKDTVLILISSMMGSVIPDNPEYDELLKEPSKDNNLDKLEKLMEGNSSNAYNFSKKGVRLLVKKNAEKYGEKGARIVSVSPGIILTPMAEEAAKEHPEQMDFLKSVTPIGRAGKSEDIANIVEFLASDKASFITGTDFTVDGGLTLNLHKLAAIK
ncbi:MAG: SDR family oxidoreductase [Miniphocaeibacter sp.]|uniref:SDR family oxidoreductase n=1 Tax=Miniphocaeibacter sp. TaxID=3100973 RepID=UPI0017EDFFF9|nr:SDR family oxidoreductase [Gallicola sp.]